MTKPNALKRTGPTDWNLVRDDDHLKQHQIKMGYIRQDESGRWYRVEPSSGTTPAPPTPPSPVEVAKLRHPDLVYDAYGDVDVQATADHQIQTDPVIQDAFWSRVSRPEIEPESACWTWTGLVVRGTPRYAFRIRRGRSPVTVTGYRMAYLILYGQIRPIHRRVYSFCPQKNSLCVRHITVSDENDAIPVTRQRRRLPI